MANVKVRFADNGNDWRFVDCQLLSRASVKREPRSRPTKNHVANLTPLRFCRYFSNNDPRLVPGRICQRNVNVAVRLNFESNYAARESEPFIFNPGTL